MSRTKAISMKLCYAIPALLFLVPHDGLHSAEPSPTPPSAAEVKRFSSPLNVFDATGGHAFACEFAFDLSTQQGENPVDARVSLGVTVEGDGTAVTLKLFHIETGGHREHYLTETTLSARDEVALFVLPFEFLPLVSSGRVAMRVRQVPNSGLDVRPRGKGSATIALTMDDQSPSWTLDDILAPVWTARSIINETGLPISEDGEPASTRLIFRPAGEVIVRNYALNTTYREGIDYVLEGTMLRLTPTSAISFLTRAQLFPDSTNAVPGTMSTHRGGLIAFGEGAFFTDRQLAISYEPANPWTGPIPSTGAGRLPRTRRLLQTGKPVKIALFGDSISTGASASGRGGRPPYIPGWGELLIRGLRAAYKSPITFVNPSKGGGSAAWGLKVAPSSLAPEKPDLCILGFGMNDGRATPVAAYIENLKQIMALVRAENPDTEFILVASMMPNPDWRSLSPMDGYLKALKELEDETTAIADVWSVSEHLLKTKRYCDLNSNHVNHPSDFMVRIYAQIALALLTGT